MSIRVEFDRKDWALTLTEMAKSATPASRKRFTKKVGAVMLRSVHKIFQTNGLNLGVVWDALSPVTKERRRKGRGGGSPQILRDKGLLFMSVGVGSFSASPKGSIRRHDKNAAILGTNLIYARAHQFGLPRRPGRVRAHTRKAAGKFTKRGKLKKAVERRILRRGAGEKLLVRVKAHATTLPKIPARPFLGWSNWAIEQTIQKADDHFFQKPAKKGGAR